MEFVSIDPAIEYRARVARRTAEYARQEEQWEAARIFILRFVAIAQFFLCIAAFGMMINIVTSHPEYLHSPIAAICFVVTEMCCGTYVFFFPAYFRKIE